MIVVLLRFQACMHAHAEVCYTVPHLHRSYIQWRKALQMQRDSFNMPGRITLKFALFFNSARPCCSKVRQAQVLGSSCTKCCRYSPYAHHRVLSHVHRDAIPSASHVFNSGWCQIAQAVIKHSKEEEEELIPKLQAMDANFQKAAMNRLEYYTGEAAARGVVLK